MIFVTVGAQMPFDRLVRSVDRWAAAEQRSNVFAQISTGSWIPQHIQWTEFLTPAEYRTKWNLPADYPMVAPNYAKQRSEFAKKIGLGRKPGQKVKRRRA